MIKTIKKFFGCSAGGVANIFAITVMPLSLLVGGSIELTNMELSKRQLSSALDAAVLAVAREITEDQEEANALGYAFLQASLPEDLKDRITEYNFQITDADVTGSASLSVQHVIFSQLPGIDTVSAHAEALREAKYVEVALVLDNTGSMGGSKISSLRSAAHSLVDILFGDQTYPEYLKVGVVPYVATVNIKNEHFSETWMDVYALNSRHGENFDESEGSVNHFTLFNQMVVEWKGCVESRPSGYDVTDDAPTTTDVETLFVPYLWPDEPPHEGNDHDYDNNYIYDDGLDEDATPAERQANAAKYVGGVNTYDETPSNTSGPNKSCPEPLTALTNDRSRVESAIDAMDTWNDGGTNGAVGLKWGWAVLSPGEPFSQGAAYDDDETRKVLVMMTDGENQIWGGWDNHNKSHYNSYGYLGLEHLGTSSKNSAKAEINDRMLTLCDNIKAQGIQIYTITFRVNSSALQDTYEACASDPSMYFNSPSDNELKSNFKVIARKIANLRLTR